MRKTKLLLTVALLLLFSTMPALAQGYINLRWDPNTEPDLKGYQMLRSTGDGTGHEVIGTILCGPGDATCTVYSDTTIIMGIPYFYVATAFNHSDKYSDFSNQVTSMVENPNPPIPPSNLQVTGQGANMALNWNASPDAEEYAVFMNTGGSEWRLLGRTTETSYTFKLPPGKAKAAWAGVKTLSFDGQLSQMVTQRIR